MRSRRLKLTVTGAVVAVLAAGTVSAASPGAARPADPVRPAVPGGHQRSPGHRHVRGTGEVLRHDGRFRAVPRAVSGGSRRQPVLVRVAAVPGARRRTGHLRGRPPLPAEAGRGGPLAGALLEPHAAGRPGGGYDSYVIAPYGAGGDLFYDDNEWVGLEKVQDYLQHHDAAALSRAEQIFTLVRSGWDTDPSHAAPGGVFWTQAPWSQDRNTVSNMPAAELGVRLYQITGKRAYLDDAKRFYDWTNANLQSPSGLYWDNVKLAGAVDQTFWTYNQGVPIGVNVLLYQATHDRTYLARAERIAEAAYDYYVTGGKLTSQPVFFNSIFFKNLLLLESVTGGHKYQQAMADYAGWVWSSARDPQTGLVHFDTGGATQSIQQAAAAQIFAVLAWPRSKWPTLY